MEIDGARAILVRCCARAGLPPPRDEDGLAAWADEIFDHALSPRGGPAWQLAHAHAIDALEAALNGDERIADASIAAAFSVVRERARRACACETRGATMRDALGRSLCARCFGRQISADS